MDYRLAHGDWFADEDLRLSSGSVTGHPPSGYDSSISVKTWQNRSPAGEEKRRRLSSGLHPTGYQVKDERIDRSKNKPKLDQKLQCEKKSTNDCVGNQSYRNVHTNLVHGDKTTVCNKVSSTYRGDNNNKRLMNQGLENAAVDDCIDSVAFTHCRGEVRSDLIGSGNTRVNQQLVVADTDMRQSSVLEKRSYISDALSQHIEARASQFDSVGVRTNDHKAVNKAVKKFTDGDYRKLPSSEAKTSFAEVCRTMKTSSDCAKSDVNAVKFGSAQVAGVSVTKSRSAKLESKSSDSDKGLKKSIAPIIDQKNLKSPVHGFAFVGRNKQNLQLQTGSNSKTSITAVADELLIKSKKLVGNVLVSDSAHNLKSEPSPTTLQRSVAKSTAGLSWKKKSDVSSVELKKTDAVENKHNKPKLKSMIMPVSVSQSKKKQTVANVAQSSVCSAAIVSQTDAKHIKKSKLHTVEISAPSLSTFLKKTDTLSERREIFPVSLIEKPAASGQTGGRILIGDTRTVKRKTVAIMSSVMPTADIAKENGGMQKEVQRIILRRPNRVDSSRDVTVDIKLACRKRRWRSNVEPSSEAEIQIASATSADHPKSNHNETVVPSIANENVRALPDYADDLDDVSSVDSCQTELRLDMSELLDDAFDDDLPRIRFDKTKSTRDLEEVHHSLKARQKVTENYNVKSSNSLACDVADTRTTLESTVASSGVENHCVSNENVHSDSVTQTETNKVPIATGSVQSLSLTEDNPATSVLLHRSSRRSKSKSPRTGSKGTRRQYLHSTTANYRSKSVCRPSFLALGEMRRSMYNDALRRSRYAASQLTTHPFASAHFNNSRPYSCGAGRSIPVPRPIGRRTDSFARPWQSRL